MRVLLLLFLVAPAVFATGPRLTRPLAIQSFFNDKKVDDKKTVETRAVETRAIPSGSCGVNKYTTYKSLFPDVAPYIVGGTTATANSHPWIVSLQSGGSHTCGGAIYNEWYILTAAHCFGALSGPSRWTVKAGKHKLGSTETTEKSYSVSAITTHESYNSFTSVNDIALMKLSTKITFTDNIQPACMPSASIGDLANTDGTVAGWGATREGGSASNTLLEVAVPIMTNTKCKSQYPRSTIADSMVCAGYDAGGKDSCQGDSGGPMTQKIGGKWTQIGIVSWGQGCAQAGNPGVYTRVSSFLSWIQKNAV